MNLNRLFDVFSLRLFVNILVVDPSISVGSNFVLGLVKFVGDRWVALEGHANGKHCSGNLFPFKELVKTPESSASAVIVHTFHVQVAFAFCRDHTCFVVKK